MNKCIRRSLAATYTVIITAILLMTGVWPSCVIHRTYSTSSAVRSADSIAPSDGADTLLPEGVTKSHSATQEHQLAQVFVSEGTRLEYVDVYVVNDVSEQMLDFAVYDGEFEQIYHKAFMTDEGTRFPGYIRVPMRLKLERGTPYIFAIFGENEGLRTGLEDHYTTANTSVYPANYDGMEDEDHNIVCGMKYSIALNTWQTAVAYAMIVLAALMAVSFLRILFGAVKERRIYALLYGRLQDKELRVGRFCQYICAILAFIALVMVWPVCYWGRESVDIIFSYISILMLTGALIYMFGVKDNGPMSDMSASSDATSSSADGISGDKVRNRRKTTADILHTVWQALRPFLTPIAIGVILWYCAEYMNGLFDIVHAYMARRILIWFFIMLITTFKKDEFINIFNGIWLIAGAVIGYFVAKPYKGDVELELLYELNGWIILTGGFIIINVLLTIVRLIRKKARLSGCFLPYALPFAVFIAGLVVLAHTRWWPAYLAVIMGLLLFRLSVWEDRSKWLKYLCDGILINFLMMVVFSLIHRPYHTYIYHRYNMSYYTVTMTATHLTMSIAAAAVRLFVRYRDLKSSGRNLIKSLLPDMMVFGAVSCYAIFTLSRTAYAAIIVMITVGLCTVAFIYCDRKNRLTECLKYIAVMFVSVAFMFPISFSATRMIPAAFDDPVIYPYEPSSGTIYPGTHPSDERYMNIRRFIEVFNSKVLNIGDTVTDARDGIFRFDEDEYPGLSGSRIELASAGNELHAGIFDIVLADGMSQTGIPVLLAADTSGYEEDEPEDATNGRLSIFRSYIEQSNLWGHDTMGAILEDGTESAHAHNIYLQVVFDHGWIFGIYFAVFMAYSWLVSIIRTYRDARKPDRMMQGSLSEGCSPWRGSDPGAYVLLVPVLLTGFMTAGMAEWIFHPCNPFGLAVCMGLVSMVFRDK